VGRGSRLKLGVAQRVRFEVGATSRRQRPDPGGLLLFNPSVRTSRRGVTSTRPRVNDRTPTMSPRRAFYRRCGARTPTCELQRFGRVMPRVYAALTHDDRLGERAAALRERTSLGYRRAWTSPRLECAILCPALGGSFSLTGGVWGKGFQWGESRRDYRIGESILWIREESGAVVPQFRVVRGPSLLAPLRRARVGTLEKRK